MRTLAEKLAIVKQATEPVRRSPRWRASMAFNSNVVFGWLRPHRRDPLKSHDLAMRFRTDLFCTA